MKNFLKLGFIVTSYILLIFVSFSSAVYVYEKKDKIKKFLNRNFTADYEEKKYTKKGVNEQDVYWAKEILNGGYILHFRHAEREKWLDVLMYDALESDVHSNGNNESRYAEYDYFADAVCLNKRGKIQARAMGETFNRLGMPIGNIHTSPSCRSRQTANLAFGGYDEMHRILVHPGPYNEIENERIIELTELYSTFKSDKGTNTMVSAHNSVVNCAMFINEEKCPSHLSLEEGGFYVLKNTKDGLVFEYEFHNFFNFHRVFHER